MATWVATQAGNWSRTSNNADSPWYDAGVQSALSAIPATGDTVNLATYAVAMDIAAIPATGALALLTASGVGKLTIDMDALGAASIAAAEIVAGTNTVANGGLLSPTNLTGADATLLITGNLTGGTVTYATALALNGTMQGAVTVIGNVSGGTGVQSYGLSKSQGGVAPLVTVIGDFIAGSGRGANALWQVYPATTASVRHTGNIVNGIVSAFGAGMPLWNNNLADGEDYYVQQTIDGTTDVKFVAQRRIRAGAMRRIG